MSSLVNLPEDALYELLPESLVDLDARGLIQAVCAGYEDRICDLRSLGGKYALFFSAVGLPEAGVNAVLVQLISGQGKVFTRSLDIAASTPPLTATPAALAAWAATELNVDPATIQSAAFGRDLLRLVDANTLDALAGSIGAVLYQSAVLSGLPGVVSASGTYSAADLSRQKLIDTYFPRLKFKGTAQSFDSLGRILGFDDVRMTPLWSRLSPRIPNDPGNAANDQDYSPIPDSVPQQNRDAFYNPLITNDGPFYTWQGTASADPASTRFYEEVVNGFNPWLTVAQIGTVVQHPAAGSFALAGGAPCTHATASPDGSGLLFTALAEGPYFNGLSVNVYPVADPALMGLSITDRLSLIKYRSSFFDLGLTVSFDKAEESFGTQVAGQNPDLASGNHAVESFAGTLVAVSPYRPFSAGSATFSATPRDFLVPFNGTVVSYTERTAAGLTTFEQDWADLRTAATQVAQALEEVRAATRLPRQTEAGYLITDQAAYASFPAYAALFTVSAGSVSAQYSGTLSPCPLAPYVATVVAISATSAGTFSGGTTPADPYSVYYGLANQGGVAFAGKITYTGTGSNTYCFTAAGTAAAPTTVYADYQVLSTQVVRPEPCDAAGTVAYQARPEDDNPSGLELEGADDYPWRRAVLAGGETVDAASYVPIAPDEALTAVSPITAVLDQTGADYTAYTRLSTAVVPRLSFVANDPPVVGQQAVGFSGAFRDLATYGPDQLDAYPSAGARVLFSRTDYDVLFTGPYQLYHVGLVDGVLLADPAGFNGPSHRCGLMAWLPFNEHQDDDLAVADAANASAVQGLYGIVPTDRGYDPGFGWGLHLRPGGTIVTSTASRELGACNSISFWIKPDAAVPGALVSTIISYGPVQFTLVAASNALFIELLDIGGNVVNESLGVVFTPGVYNFIFASWTASSVLLGIGGLNGAISTGTSPATPRAFAATDTVLAFTTSARGYTLRDFRMWNVAKQASDGDAVRNYQPGTTAALYRLGELQCADNFDRYGFQVLPNGWVIPAALPPWTRVEPALKAVRYTGLGEYVGESRFKATGLGGGQAQPPVYQLGLQGPQLATTGGLVVSTQHGGLPGVDPFWAQDTAPGHYILLNGSSASGSIATVAASGSGASPWPNLIEASNAAVDRFWTKGDDGYVYEVTLVSTGSASAGFAAERVARTKTDAELELLGALQVLTTAGSCSTVVAAGTLYPNELLVTAGTSAAIDDGAGHLVPSGQILSGVLTPATGAVQVFTSGVTEVRVLMPKDLYYTEQPTGAEMEVAAPGTILSVSTTGSVYQKLYSGTVTRPPAYVYLNEQLLQNFSGASLMAAWEQPNVFGLDLGAPALTADGKLTFVNSGTLLPGNYRLSLTAGNVGQVDANFTGFNVTVTVGATLVQATLLPGATGANFQGTTDLDFAIADTVTGTWLLTVDWVNSYSDPAHGTARQLAIYGYQLYYLAAQLYQVAIGVGSPAVTLLTTSTFAGTTPGGWVAAYNSYGSVAAWEHESTIYPGNDTLVSTAAANDLLTASTGARQEDMLFYSGTNLFYLLPDTADPVFTAFGTGFTVF